MSGDGLGLIIGGLIAAPVILAGLAIGAAAGIAYGAFKIGQFLVGAAMDHAEEVKKKKIQVWDSCSKELEAMYGQLQSVTEVQAEAFSRCATETNAQIEAAAKRFEAMAEETPTDFPAVNAQMQQSQQEITALMQNHRAAVQKEVIEQGRAQMQRCVETLAETQRIMADAVDWRKQDAAAQAQQKALAYAQLQDAKASLGVMRNLIASYGDATLKGQYTHMETAYAEAEKAFDAGMYSAAFSSSRTLVRQAAIAVADHQMRQLELNASKAQVQAQLLGLQAEMEHRRYVSFDYEETDEATGKTVTRHFEEDLADFCQDRYEELQELLEAKIQELRRAETLYEVQRLETELETVLKPTVVKVVEVAQQVMLGYREKLAVMRVIKRFMQEQNYVMDWAVPQGGDLSQKLVAHFSDNTGASISIAIDNQAETGDIVSMVLEVLTFYEGGRVVTEDEKQRLREKLNAALNEAGIQGSVACSGNVGEQSSKKEFSTEEGTMDQPVREIVGSVYNQDQA